MNKDTKVSHDVILEGLDVPKLYRLVGFNPSDKLVTSEFAIYDTFAEISSSDGAFYEVKNPAIILAAIQSIYQYLDEGEITKFLYYYGSLVVGLQYDKVPKFYPKTESSPELVPHLMISENSPKNPPHVDVRIIKIEEVGPTNRVVFDYHG